MGKVVLITGSSSGIGLAAARYFQERQWQVVATMRYPEKRQTPLHGLPGVERMHLDVTDPASIRQVVKAVAGKYPALDVLVNNAGYSLTGLFEDASPEQIQQQFATNVFGLMEMTRQTLPLFRKQKRGTIVNVASMAGRVGFAMYSLYNSTKWAVEGFSEALAYELKDLNIKVKLIEPGMIKTDFYDRSMVTPEQTWDQEYGDYPRRALSGAMKMAATGSSPEVVAKLIYQAATDPSSRLRYSGGKFAKLVLGMRRFFPDRLFMAVVRMAMQSKK